MILVYMAVRNVEVGVARYSFARYTSSRQRNVEMSRRVMSQGILYSTVLASICLAYILMIIYSSYAAQLLDVIVIPLQGFWNALIYKKRQIKQIVKKILCKSRQSVPGFSGSIQNNQNTTSKPSCWKRLSMFWNRIRSSKKSKSSSNQQVEVKEESKMNESNLMLSSVGQEEANDSFFSALSQNSDLKNKEETSQLEYFSTVDENEGNDSDDESYVDDYLRMMEIES